MLMTSAAAASATTVPSTRAFMLVPLTVGGCQNTPGCGSLRPDVGEPVVGGLDGHRARTGGRTAAVVVTAAASGPAGEVAAGRLVLVGVVQPWWLRIGLSA